MLFGVTLVVDICAMAVSLWMAFYLFGRGFPSPVSLGAVLLLILVAIFFFGVYNNIFHETVSSVALRAVMVIVGLGIWYSLTFQLMSAEKRKRLRRFRDALYVLCGITAVLLLGASGAFTDVQANPLYMPHMSVALPFILYVLFLALISVGILYNLLTDRRMGLTPQGKYFLVASIFIISAVGYGVTALVVTPALPRLIMDALILSGVTFLGISVARHQTLVERRTTFQDFPASAITILGISAFYVLLATRLGLPLQVLAVLVVLIILTHSLYDLVREFLERLRIRKESTLRRQLRRLENESFDEESLRLRLQDGLDLLSQTLKSSGGFVAVRRGGDYRVIATRQSLLSGSRLPFSLVACEDLMPIASDQLPEIRWVAPAFEGGDQVAVVGIRQPMAKRDFSRGDLDLLSEVADRMGIIISLSDSQPGRTDRIQQLVAESQDQTTELHSSADEMLATIANNPDMEFIKLVEEGLRHLPDSIALGQSPLVDRMGVRGPSHVERGKKLQKLLIDSMEALRPAGERPPEPLPREWYSFAILHDAYLEGVPNREIMARLYISEGTFNRTRRTAIRGFARLIMERRDAL